MKGQIADKLNTEERCELKDEDLVFPKPANFQCPMRRMSGQLKPISGMLLKIKKKSWHAGS